MDIQGIKRELRSIIDEKDILSIPDSEILDADNFVSLGIDSLRMVTFLTAIEMHFKFDIPPDEFNLENFSNMNDLAQYISSKVNS